ncbi:MAG: nodulation protein NfeD [Campylobacterales bacterium]
MKKFFLLLLLSAPLWAVVVTGRWEGAITPAAGDYLERVLKTAGEKQASAVVLELDTPGGLVNVTREMVTKMAAAKMPVVVYVGPDGAQAASAGAILTVAADVAAMAKVSNIGSASVVSMGQEMDETMRAKAMEDMKAFVRTLADRHERNSTAIEAMVSEAKNFTAAEALRANIIDLIAVDRADLLRQLEGYLVQKHEIKQTVNVGELIEVSVSFAEKLLTLLADPSFVYLLLMIGFYGLIIEFYNPGSFLPGISGLVAISLALYGLGAMEASWLAVALIGIGVLLFALELFTPTFGVLSTAGAASILAGSLLLFDSDSPYGVLPLETIIFTVIASAVIMGFIAYMGLKAQRRKIASGKESFIGRIAEVKKPLTPKGKVMIDGELWNAISADGTPIEGGEVEVSAEEGLLLTVRRSEKSSSI